MASIFEITAELEQIQQALESGVDCRMVDDPENTPEMADKALEELIERELATTEALKSKLDGYCSLISEMEWRAIQAGNEIARLKRIKDAHESLNQKLRDMMKFALTRLNLDKVETPLHRVALAKIAPAVEVDEFMPIPEEFLRVKTEVDKVAIKAALKSGRELPFAQWGPPGVSLRIK